MPNLKILFAASECAPFVKTGGLADVASALPRALAENNNSDYSGIDIRVVLPLYAQIKAEYADQLDYICDFTVVLGWRRQYCGVATLTRGNIIYYFIDNEYYFCRPYIYGSFCSDEAERFGFFSKSIIELMHNVGFFPDVLHLNDWQTAPAAAILKLTFGNVEPYNKIKTVFTIHNLRFQGIFDKGFVSELLSFKPEDVRGDTMEHDGAINYLKSALAYSDAVTTVSPAYAREIQTGYYGEKLDWLLRARSNELSGILNGIDCAEFDPALDDVIAKPYSIADMSGKSECKAALMRELGLTNASGNEAKGEKPLIAIISRLTDQKGLDLVEHVINELIDAGLRIVALGTGESRYEDLFTWAQWRFPGRVAARIEYSDALAHRIYAGADFFLMPSRFEPCGLSQLIALRYGTIPIVRETGGLKDTVEPYNKYFNTGTGFSFTNYNAHELLYTVQHACALYYDERDKIEQMRLRGMQQDFGWSESANKYLELYERLTK